MNWLVYHIVSGQAFFTGTVLLVFAALASTRRRPFLNRLVVISFLIGAIAIFVSSTPIASWFAVVAGAFILAWIASRYYMQLRPWAAYGLAGWVLLGGILEIPYHHTPTLHQVLGRQIAVIGDSVTAGMSDDESGTWPVILAREHQLAVQDISHMGETASSALKRAKSQEIAAPLVVVEIGGNDLLGSTSAAKFERDLNELLSYLAQDGREIVMFELPLPPLSQSYSRAQRSAASKHNVRLVPKRVFLSILAGEGSTLDTIHLSPTGHQRMAECVWRLVESAYD